MIAGMLLTGIGLIGGVFIGYLIWGDRAGTYYIPDALDEKSGWIHDGRLYTFEKELNPRPIDNGWSYFSAMREEKEKEKGEING